MVTYTTGDTVCPLGGYSEADFGSCVCACVCVCVCVCVCMRVTCDILCRLAAGVFNDTTEFQNEARWQPPNDTTLQRSEGRELVQFKKTLKYVIKISGIYASDIHLSKKNHLFEAAF